ncbi:MAG: hypothetical protein ACYTFV_04470, partial [Planctomycetota bacterium]
EGSTFELRLESEPEQEDRRLLERSLFLDPPDLAARVWAADAALRCPSIAAVVLEGKGLRVPAGRRLQLAAEAEGGVAFVARAADEAREVSAATTRWRVRRAAPTSGAEGDERPRWELELLRVRAGSTSVRGGSSSCCGCAPDRPRRPRSRGPAEQEWSCDGGWRSICPTGRPSGCDCGCVGEAPRTRTPRSCWWRPWPIGNSSCALACTVGRSVSGAG